MDMIRRRQFFFFFIIIILVLPTLFYLTYINEYKFSMKNLVVPDFLNKGEPLIYCKLKEFSKKLKPNVYSNNTQAYSLCKYLSSRRLLREKLKKSILKLNISNTCLDVLSAEKNLLLSGKVRYSDYISLPDPNLGKSLVRYIEYTSLQWIVCINESEIREFRESEEYMFRDFYKGEIGPEYTDLLKEPFPFLEDLKSPCWIDERYGLLCLPYMYLIGFPKSGTTDVYARIKEHPQFVPARVKEPHWLTRQRFGGYGDLRNFLKRHYGPVSSYISNRYHKNGKSNFNRIITGDFSASSGFDNAHWRLLPENKNRTEPLHTNADYIRHLYPETKIVAILRNPVERLYSGYKFFNKCELSPHNFHKNVVASLDAIYRCFRLHSIRRCAYDDRLHHGRLRLWIGMYYIYLLDYHRTFPRNQIFVFTTANYSKNTLSVTEEIFRFLELDPINEEVANKIKERKQTNVGRKNIGPMLNETRKILNDFYRPFNRLLADLLNNSLFNFDLEGN